MKEKKSVVEKYRYLEKEERGKEISFNSRSMFAVQNSIDRESSHTEKKQGVK